MTDDDTPINPRAWGDYVEGGRGHFERVGRSRDVFVRNTNELLQLLAGVETDSLASARLFGHPHEDSAEGEFRREFWGRLDQRLHNAISAAVSLVEHTRPLIDFYDHEARFTAEWATRNQDVRESDEASFLRRLRNYLLHYGAAPVMQTIRLGRVSQGESEGLTIGLSPNGLLAFDGWNNKEREFIRGFASGVPIRRVVTKYAISMEELYKWLFAQYDVFHVAGVPPAHLYPNARSAPEARS